MASLRGAPDSGTHASGGNITLTPATAGYVSGDLIVITAADDANGTIGGLARLTTVPQVGAAVGLGVIGGYLIGSGAEAAFTLTTTGTGGWGAKLSCYNPDGGTWGSVVHALADDNTTTTTTSSVTTPSSGDVLVHIAGMNDSTSAPTLPGGYTEVGSRLSPSSCELVDAYNFGVGTSTVVTPQITWDVADNRFVYVLSASATGGGASVAATERNMPRGQARGAMRGAMARSMEKINGIWRPPTKIIVPVGIQLQGA